MLSVSAHLTDRDRELTRMVARHRVLTTDQLAALRFSNLTTARRRLSALVRLGLLRRFRPHRETGFVRDYGPQLFVSCDRSLVLVKLLFVSFDRS